MGGLFSALFAKLSAIVEWVVSLVKQLVTDAWEMFTDVPVWAFDQLLGIVVSAVGELDLSGISGHAQSWGNLPGEVLNAVAFLGGGEAAVLIVAAIGIRLVLQLIPFTRLGS